MIYLFHKVHPDAPANNENWITPKRFDEFLASGRKFVSLDTYLSNGRQGDVITFDGIYADVYEWAWPLLDDGGFPFEMFCTWSALGKGNEWDEKEPPAKFASLHDIVAMAATGLGRIQDHSFTHPKLSSLSVERVEYELSNPFRLPYFAYPYGKFDTTCLDIARRNFQGALSVRQGDDSQYQLHREFYL